MIVSVVCPTLNEEKYVGKVIDFFQNSQPADKEIFFIDGGSTDKTIAIIEDRQKTDNRIHLLHNPDKIVPFALNIAIPQTKGRYIVRLDAHCEYDIDYFKNILETFGRVDADIVGGPTLTTSRNPFQEAVAYIFNTPLGMGDSSVHQPDYEGYTDSVTFGAWKKEIFEKTGLFDTRLKRNQDDEFHYRAKSLGFKLYQSPTIKLYYFPRSNVKGLFKQYYQFGLYKPMVLKKIKTEIKLRHLIPSLFVLYLVGCLVLACKFPVVLVPLLLYLLLAIYYSLKAKTSSFIVHLYIAIAYPTVHIAYGTGFLLGLRKII